MEQQELQPRIDQPEQDPPIEDRRPWAQPKLVQLHVSLDTAAGGGSVADAVIASSKAPPP